MFKYYSIPNEEIADKIVGSFPTIKFGSAYDLNDPFELKFNLKIDPYANGQEEEYFKRNIGKKHQDFIEWQKQVNDQFIWYTEQEQRKQLAQLVTLSSFTENNCNNLMWSHYTNNHQGICVEYSEKLFERLKSLDNYFTEGRIEYSEIPPVINNLESMHSQVKKMLFNKQSEWIYEKENRVILTSRNEVDYIPINRELVKAVYIGSKCEPKIEKHIIDLCNQNSTKIYQGITFGNSYKVNFKEHKESIVYMKRFWG